MVKRMRDTRIIWLLYAVLAAVVGPAGTGMALDSPHFVGNSVHCLSCHQPHKAFGKNLTRAESNPLVCQGCHNPVGIAKNLAMHDSDRAVPGEKGNTHFWSMPVNNPKWGSATPPDTTAESSDASMYPRLDSTDPTNLKVICSTCHNQHNNSSRWGRIHLSSVERVFGSGPTGTVMYKAVDHQASAQGYQIEIVQGGPMGVAKYIIAGGLGQIDAMDNSGFPKWFGWDGSQWVEFTGPAAHDAAAAMPRLIGVDQQLRDGAKVTVTFDTSSAQFKAGDRFKFYVGYPFLRRAHDSGPNPKSPQELQSPKPGVTYFCRNCHSQRAQSHVDVETWTGTPRSHPVGQKLGSNGKGYDRSKPLDANGRIQNASYPNSPDGNWTNDLLLYEPGTAGYPVSDPVPVVAVAFGNPESGDVQCMTCHAPHFTDSNSLTVDKR